MVCTVIGEGGSGGALAIGVGNRVQMLQNAIYSVISPEACAAILWRDDRSRAPEAAETLKMSAGDALGFGLIDEIVREPLGGAHRDHRWAANLLRRALRRNLAELAGLSGDELVRQREDKFRTWAASRRSRSNRDRPRRAPAEQAAQTVQVQGGERV